MNKHTTIEPITTEIFRARYQELKQLLIGKGDQIAELAGTDYRRWTNAIRGMITSPELLEPLYEAMEQVAKEEYEKISI